MNGKSHQNPFNCFSANEYDFIGKLKNYILLNINMYFQKPGNKMAKE